MATKKTNPPIELTPELLYSFTTAFLLSQYDQPKPIPDFHLDLWRYMCSPKTKVAAAAPRNHAKAQALSSKVLTPTGWKTIGELKVGEKVIGGNGKPVKVTHLHPVSDMDLYRVTTRDGKSSLCNLDHLWNVVIPSNQKGLQTLSLREILNNWKSKRGTFTEYRYFIPTIKPVEFKEKSFSVDPYTLGAWLGDGHSAGTRFTTNDPEILTYFPYKTEKQSAKYGYVIRDLYSQLKSLELLNNKHVPVSYLLGSVDQRLSLLQGLMDTDGTCHQDNKIAYFCNKNENLIDNVVSLVRSLGGIAKKYFGYTTCNGKEFHSWRVSVKLPKELNPFRLRRKADRWLGSTTKSSIVSIEKETTAKGRCITVEGSTYITDDYLLTHNSTAVTHAYTLANICFRLRNYVVIISDTEEQSSEFLGDIKKEVKENELLREQFGIKRVVKDNETNFIFEFEDGGFCRLIAKGSGQKIRGRKWRGKRPDLIVGDDLENDEIVMNDDSRKKFKRWIFNAVLPSGNDGCLFRFVGTILHMDSFLANVVPLEDSKGTIVGDNFVKWETPEDHAWHSITFKAHPSITEFSPQLWPAKFPEARLRAEYAAYRDIGESEGYSQEYLNKPLDESVAYFRAGDFQPLSVERSEKFEYYSAADLAIGQKDSNAYSVIATVSKSDLGKHRVVDIRMFRGDAFDIITEMFAVHEKYRPELFILEEENIAKSLGAVINSEMDDRQMYLNMHPVKPAVDKIKRARPLQARMRAGAVEFDTDADWYEGLEQELRHFPRGKYADQVDALAWVFFVLDQMRIVTSKEEDDDEQWQEDYEEHTFSADEQCQVTGY